MEVKIIYCEIRQVCIEIPNLKKKEKKKRKEIPNLPIFVVLCYFLNICNVGIISII